MGSVTNYKEHSSLLNQCFNIYIYISTYLIISISIIHIYIQIIYSLQNPKCWKQLWSRTLPQSLQLYFPISGCIPALKASQGRIVAVGVESSRSTRHGRCSGRFEPSSWYFYNLLRYSGSGCGVDLNN